MQDIPGMNVNLRRSRKDEMKVENLRIWGKK
jgi:hypothetical protein